MAKDKKTPKQTAKFREIADQVAEGKDIVAIAAGAKGLATYKDALTDNEVAKLFAVPKRKMGRPTKYEPEWMLEGVIEAGRFGASKEKMAAMIGISKDTLYKWMEEHADFSDAVKEGELLAQVWWENCGQTAALGSVDGFNSTAWIFSMKNRFPHIYRDVKVTELNSTGAPLIDARSITINARELDPEYRQSLKMALLAAKRAIEGEDDD